MQGRGQGARSGSAPVAVSAPGGRTPEKSPTLVIAAMRRAGNSSPGAVEPARARPAAGACWIVIAIRWKSGSRPLRTGEAGDFRRGRAPRGPTWPIRPTRRAIAAPIAAITPRAPTRRHHAPARPTRARTRHPRGGPCPAPTDTARTSAEHPPTHRVPVASGAMSPADRRRGRGPGEPSAIRASASCRRWSRGTGRGAAGGSPS